MRFLFTQNDLSSLRYLQKAGNLTAEDAVVHAIFIVAQVALRDSRRHEGPFVAGRANVWNEPYGTSLLDAKTAESLFAEERKKPCDHYVDFNFSSHTINITGATIDLEKLGNGDMREVLFFAAAAVRALEKEGHGARLVAGNWDGIHEKPRTHTRLKTPFDQTLGAEFGRMLRGKSGKQQVNAVKFQAKGNTPTP